MPTELCWSCKQVKSGVILRSSDDRLCTDCNNNNERQLQRQRRQHSEASASVPPGDSAVDATITLAGSTNTKQRKKTNKRETPGLIASKTDSRSTNDVDIDGCLQPLQAQAPDQNAQSVNLINKPMSVTIESYQDQFNLMQAEIQQQKSLIIQLQQQLSFVLSFLGIAEQDVLPVKNKNNATITPNDGASDNHNINNSSTADSPVLQQAWSTVVGSSNVSKLQQTKPKHVANFQQSLIAAVYVDQSERKRRESTLIVSGLQVKDSCADNTLFSELCIAELSVQPDIVTTKRLGREQPGKIQPMLVVLRKADQAQLLIAKAKQLRKSHDPIVCSSVFINQNLTHAEAEAAFRVRVQRRQSMVNRTSKADAGLQPTAGTNLLQSIGAAHPQQTGRQ
jgi:hypothetical protein